MYGPARQRPCDDLFEMFPDLPRPRLRIASGQRARIFKLVAAARTRVIENAARQMRASARLRDSVAARQQAQLRRRILRSAER